MYMEKSKASFYGLILKMFTGGNNMAWCNSDSEKPKDLKVKMYRSNVCGHPDKPIEKNDNDLFVVDMYVDGLCEFVCNCSTPMTISIQGDWGSGKTSMMKMMEERIKNARRITYFNDV